MREWIDLVEEAFGTTEKLFHGSNLDNLWLIMADGKLTSDAHGRGYAGPTGVCLSRSFKVALSHAGAWAENLSSTFFEYFRIDGREGFCGTVVFEFDRSRISQPIISYDDFGTGEGAEGDEEEERVVGDLSLDACTRIYVRKGEIEEFMAYAEEARKKDAGIDSQGYGDEFKTVMQKILTDPRVEAY